MLTTAIHLYYSGTGSSILTSIHLSFFPLLGFYEGAFCTVGQPPPPFVVMEVHSKTGGLLELTCNEKIHFLNCSGSLFPKRSFVFCTVGTIFHLSKKSYYHSNSDMNPQDLQNCHWGWCISCMSPSDTQRKPSRNIASV